MKKKHKTEVCFKPISLPLPPYSGDILKTMLSTPILTSKNKKKKRDNGIQK